MTNEKLFENRLKKWLHSQGIYAAGVLSQKMEKVQHGWFLKVWGGGFQKSGIPDLLMCVNGFFISVELKSTIGTATDLQKLNTARINAANGIGLILYPEGFGEFKEIIKGVIECNGHIAALNSLRIAHSNSKSVILMN